MDHNEKLKMVRAMKIYGGSFVEALAECFLLADENNLKKLVQAFPNEVAQYCDMGAHLPSEVDPDLGW